MAKVIVKGGNLAWGGKPGRGGHVMFILQWLEGLRRLGHEVLYYDSSNGAEAATRLFATVMERHWRPELSSLMRLDGEASYGLDRAAVETFAANAAAVISLGCTFQPEPDPWLASTHPRVLVEQDPGFSHDWAGRAERPEEIFGNHDVHFTVGALVGTPACQVETFGLDWIGTWNPVVLDWWDPDASIVRDRFTTIAGWWTKILPRGVV